MKQKLQKSLLLCLLYFVGITAFAYDFEIDGIYYYYGTKSQTVSVTYQNTRTGGYSGVVEIPETVQYNDTYYTVTSIGFRAFRNCNGLTSVVIPNSVTSIDEDAFENCSGLLSVTIPNSVTSIGNYAFEGCCSLTSVIIPNSITSIGDKVFYGCSDLASVIIPNSVTSIGPYAFAYCSSLTSVIIPKSVTTIGDRSFYFCSSLTSLAVESGNPVYNSREGCNAIIETCSNTLIAGCQNTVIPNNLTCIGDYAFAGCSNLTSVAIPSSITSISSTAFYGCSGLTSIVVASDNRFYDSRENCNAIIETRSNTLIAGCSNTVIPGSVTSIGSYAFVSSGLKSLAIPDSVTSIGHGAFFKCSNLTEVTIGSFVFYGCSSLTSVGIPNSVTSIGSEVFEGCNGLTSVTIGNSVTTIGNKTFFNCSSLTEVISLNPNPPTIGNGYYDAFESITKRDAILYVPAGSKDAYAWAAVWREFLNIHEGIPSIIEAVAINKANSPSLIYPLDGAKVGVTDRSALPAGLYIIDGKKRIVK